MNLTTAERTELTDLVKTIKASANLLERYSELAEQNNRPCAAVELIDAATALRHALWISSLPDMLTNA